MLAMQMLACILTFLVFVNAWIVLCPSGGYCAPKFSCPPADVCSAELHHCEKDGSCRRSAADCPSEVVCPPTMVMCPDGHSCAFRVRFDRILVFMRCSVSITLFSSSILVESHVSQVYDVPSTYCQRLLPFHESRELFEHTSQ